MGDAPFLVDWPFLEGSPFDFWEPSVAGRDGVAVGVEARVVKGIGDFFDFERREVMFEPFGFGVELRKGNPFLL